MKRESKLCFIFFSCENFFLYFLIGICDLTKEMSSFSKQTKCDDFDRCVILSRLFLMIFLFSTFCNANPLTNTATTTQFTRHITPRKNGNGAAPLVRRYKTISVIYSFFFIQTTRAEYTPCIFLVQLKLITPAYMQINCLLFE